VNRLGRRRAWCAVTTSEWPSDSNPCHIARTPLHAARPFHSRTLEGWRFLWQPALLGFVAMSFILAGCSFTNSPFKLDLPARGSSANRRPNTS